MSDACTREVRFLKWYSAALTLALGVLATSAFRQERPTSETFEEITVQRINIVEPDGKYRMVLSNRPKSIGPIYKGKPFGYPGGGRPGIIFFNDEGSENGGLTFTGRRDSLGRYRSNIHMSFDQYDQDQVLNLDYADNNGRRRVGMSVDDRPDLNIYDLVQERDSIMQIADSAARAAALERWRAPRNGVPLVARRVFVGRDPERSAIVNLSDPSGQPRLRLVVDSVGDARIEFLDARGQVARTLRP